MIYCGYMDDILPFILVVSLIILLVFAGLGVYALSFFMSLILAISIVVSGLVVILSPIIFWLIPNVDNKDAIIAMRSIVFIAFIAGLAVLIANLIKAFAIR